MLRLARSRSSNVRRAVAQNFAAPKEALVKLVVQFPEDVLNNPACDLFNLEEEMPFRWIPTDRQFEVLEKHDTPFVRDKFRETMMWFEEIEKLAEITAVSNEKIRNLVGQSQITVYK